MRLLLMFDMPVETKEQRRNYRIFVKNLKLNGFLMMQYSVYSRFCSNDTAAIKYINRIIKKKPNEGDIRIIKITDIQYEDMIFIQGEQNHNENILNKNDLIEID